MNVRVQLMDLDDDGSRGVGWQLAGSTATCARRDDGTSTAGGGGRIGLRARERERRVQGTRTHTRARNARSQSSGFGGRVAVQKRFRVR